MKTRISILIAAAALAACSQDAPEEARTGQADEAADHVAHDPAQPLPGDGAAPVIEVENGWVRSTPGGNDVTAAYFTLVNTGGADRLLGAASDQIGEIQLHASLQDENGVTRMEHLTGVDVPANGSAEFSPGAHHLMLFGAADLALGDTLCLTLDFERADDRIACLPVMDEAPF